MMKRLFGKTKTITFSNDKGRPQLNLDLEKLRTFRNEGRSNREMARLFKCSEATIRNRMKQLDDVIEPRS